MYGVVISEMTQIAYGQDVLGSDFLETPDHPWVVPDDIQDDLAKKRRAADADLEPRSI